MNPQQDGEPNAAPHAKASPYLADRDFYRDPRYKSPITATVLSLMPGLGHVYLGYTRLGFIHGFTFATAFAFLASNAMGRFEPFMVISLFFFFGYNLVDAYRRAVLMNEALTRLERPELPDGFGTISFTSRLAGGVLLILVGMLTLLHIRFGVSLQWLYDWWPAGLVLMGVYLILRALQDRASEADPH